MKKLPACEKGIGSQHQGVVSLKYHGDGFCFVFLSERDEMLHDFTTSCFGALWSIDLNAISSVFIMVLSFNGELAPKDTETQLYGWHMPVSFSETQWSTLLDQLESDIN